MVRTLYFNRWLLYELVLRDVVLRYRGSALGFFWTLLTPLLLMAVYVLVFSVFLRIDMPHYPVFLLASLLPWQWFANSLQAGTNSIVEGRMYVGKVVLAPIVLVLVPVLSNAVHFALSLPILLILAAIFHVQVGWSILALPVLIGVQFLLTLGLLLLLATFNVFYRDALQLVSVLLMLLFYLTPIVYPLTSVPEHWRLYALANPMTALTLSYQAIFYFHSSPNWAYVLYAFAFSAVLSGAGLIVFDRYKDTFADYV